MMVKREDQECRLINVEARLQDDHLRERTASAVSADGEMIMPPIEIQFEKREESASPPHLRRGDEGPVILIPEDVVSDGDKHHDRSNSVFSLSDLLGSNTASTANSTTASSSFFPFSIANVDTGSSSEQAQAHPDEGSVMSAAYFDASDFSPMQWTATLTEHEVMVGLAVIYLTISLTHPLLFLAGAFAAVSTATAASAGYDYFTDGPFGKCPCGSLSMTDDTTTTATKTIEDTTETRLIASGDDTQREETQKPSDALVVLEPTPRNRKGSNIGVAAGGRVSTGTNLKTMSTLVEFSGQENWLALHYPPLSEAILQRRELFGLNVAQFVDVFLANDAPYHYMEFQKKRGDKNIEYGKWQSVVAENTPNDSPLSMHPDASVPFPQELEYSEFMTRTLQFQAKTNNTFFGPPYASTTKEQRLLVVNKRFAILENKTTLADIPFCDRFHVMERWVITADKDDDGNYRCQLSSSCQVFFHKSCPFEAQIRTKTKSSIEDVSKAWLHMATQALLLSEQHKQKRLRQEQKELMLEDDDDDEEVGLDIDGDDAGKRERTPPPSAPSEEDEEPSVEVTESDLRGLVSKTSRKGSNASLPALRRISSSLSSSYRSEGRPSRNMSLSRLAHLLASPRRKGRGRAATADVDRLSHAETVR